MPKEFQQITDYEESALSLQVEFFKNKANMEKLIKVLTKVVQNREDGLAGLYDLIFLDMAFGIHLDNQGEYLNVPRNSDNDDVYRNRIKTAIHELNNGGQIEPLIAAFKVLVNANKVILDEYYPETVILTALVDDTTITNPATINAAMQRVRAAGIDLDVGVSLDEYGFEWASVPNDFSSTQGLSSTSGGMDGGELGVLIE